MKWMGLALLTVLACWGQERPASFPVAGTVVDGVTGRPMARVRVVLSPEAQPNGVMSAHTTGADGHFQFVVPQGRYSLKAERPGLPPQPYGATSLVMGFGVAIVAGPGQDTSALTFRVSAPGAIVGKVVDEAGDPVENAAVQVLISAAVQGRRTLSVLGAAHTDDRGEYRLSPMPAGTFYLAVTAKPWYASQFLMAQAPTNPIAGISFAPAYFDNTANPRAATPIQLKQGEEVQANFTLHPTSGGSLWITCESCKGTDVRLDVSSEGILGTRNNPQTSSMRESLRMTNLPPGHYLVRARNNDRNHPLFASAEVDVGEGEASVGLALNPAPLVSGTVSVTDQDRPALASLVLMLLSETPPVTGFPLKVEPDGRFQGPVLFSGNYRLQTMGAEGLVVDQLTVNGEPARDGLIAVGGSDLRLGLVASRGTGQVKGFVKRGGGAVSGLMVVAAMASLPADPTCYSGYVTDSDGSFDFTALRPGDYRLFTVDDEQFEYANPAAVKPHMVGGLAVRVEARGQVEQNIELP